MTILDDIYQGVPRANPKGDYTRQNGYREDAEAAEILSVHPSEGVEQKEFCRHARSLR
jgi:hypothetical protein